MSRFEDDLGTALRGLVPDDVPRPGLATRVPTLAARRRTTRRGLLLLVPAAAAGAVLGERWLTGDDRAAVPAAPPPPVDVTAPHLVVSPDRVPPGATVALWVAQPTGTDLGVYGAAGTVERWTGSGWTPETDFASGWSGTFAGKVRLGEGDGVEDIGLGAQDGTGPLELLSLDGLDPGVYRLGHPGQNGTAWGVVRVDPAAPPAPEVAAAPGRTVGLTFDEPVVGSGSPALIVGNPWVRPPDGTTTDEVVGLMVGTLSGPADLDRWVGTTWQALPGALPVRDLGNRAVEVTLPALDPGTYRVGLTSSVAGRLTAPVWAR